MSDARDARDRRRIMDSYGPPIYRCPGGRLVADGYVCVHCGSPDPHSICLAKTA